MAYLRLCSFLGWAVCLRIAFNREVEKNWKRITMLRLVEDQASCPDERYLLNSVERLGPIEQDVNSICPK